MPQLDAVGISIATSSGLRQGILVIELAHCTLQDKKFEKEELVMVAWALASTLALLNAAGFIHGDLKPSNVLWKDSHLTKSESARAPAQW